MGVGLAQEFEEHGVSEINGDRPLLPAYYVRVTELDLEAGVLDTGGGGPLPLLLVEENVVPLGLGLAHHHILHPIQRFRRTEKNKN